jgi:hypothetical protein
MVIAIGHDEWRDGACDCSDFAAGEALVFETLEEPVRIAGLRGAFALEGPFRALSDPDDTAIESSERQNVSPNLS